MRARGVIPLAAALSIPLTTDSGAAFPHRPLLLVVATGAVVVSLVVQGTTLHPLVRRLGEPLQTDLALMSRLSSLGIRPGLPVVAQRTGRDVRVATDLGEIEVPAPTAHHVFVDMPLGVS